MKLEIREDSKNYACTVVKLPPKQKVDGLDNLVKVTVFGNDVLTKKDADENQLYLFFPAECRIAASYLCANNEFRHSNLNYDQTAKPGFFEDTGRVKAIKFKGVISTGYIAPIDTLYPLMGNWGGQLKEGDEFTDIDGVNICKKYKIVHQHATTAKESRFNKKLKRFDKLVPNQFRFHVDTNQLAKNLHLFKPEDIICITDKWHGTSAVFANVLVNKQLTVWEKIGKLLGFNIVDKVYDTLYSSRSVIKNQYVNKEATAGYYNEDIWKVVLNEIKDKIEQGITIYGEIVGYLPSGKAIQKAYDYGCNTGMVGSVRNDDLRPVETDAAQHKFLVYRITYTKPDGNTIEFSWNQIKGYCEKYQLETVKELYYGKLNRWANEGTAGEIFNQTFIKGVDQWGNELLSLLSSSYLEKDCPYCTNKVPAEGIVVRIDGKDTFSAFKLKSKRFLEKESKQLDEDSKTGEVNIEDQVVEDNA